MRRGDHLEFSGEAPPTTRRLPMGGNFNHSGATRVNVMREIESSLRRLQTDYIDLYQVHGWDSNTPLEETLRTLNDLVRQGKVRYIGLSNLMSWQAATAIMLQEASADNRCRKNSPWTKPDTTFQHAPELRVDGRC